MWHIGRTSSVEVSLASLRNVMVLFKVVNEHCVNSTTVSLITTYAS